MKVTVYLNGVYISAKRINGYDKDNRPTANEYIAIENSESEEVGNIKCVTAVFDEIQKEKKYSKMTFQGVVDTWNKDIVITGYKPVQEKV